MIRLHTMMAMQKFSDSLGAVNSVADVFEPADKWSQASKPAKNAYASEFRLVSLPADMGEDEECVAIPADDSSKRSKEKYFATAFRGKKGDSRNKVMSLLWAQEGDYWKIIAIRIEDSSDAGLVPNNAAALAVPAEEEPQNIAGDPASVKDITQFYQTWIVKRDVTQASALCITALLPVSRGTLRRPEEIDAHRQNPVCAGTAADENTIQRESLRHDVECAARQRSAAPSPAGKLQGFRDHGRARPDGR